MWWYGEPLGWEALVKSGARIQLFALLAATSLPLGFLHAQPPASLPQAPLTATSVAGSDIGDRVNHALKSCALQCTVYIPAGNYSYSVSINLQLNTYGRYKLSGDPGAILTYTGKGDAITTSIGDQPGYSQLLIEGFQLKGNPHAVSGIHMLPTNRISIRNMVITGFSGGDGILVEGTNSSNIYDNMITSNKNGIRLIPSFCGGQPVQCGTTVQGPPYAANAIHVTYNQITNNSQWAIVEDAIVVGRGLTEMLNNLYMGNDLEGNGGGYLSNQIPGSRHRSKLLRRIAAPGGAWAFPKVAAVTARTAQWCAITTSPPRRALRTTSNCKTLIVRLLRATANWLLRLVPKNCFVNMVRRNAHLDFKERDLSKECVLY